MVTLETRMPYDSYQWSNGKTTPAITVKRNDKLPGQTIKIELEVTYKGCVLRDHVNITFLK